MTIKLAVIGAGVMGADHARIVAGDMPGATLQVVCDASTDRARSVADSCGATHTETDPLATIARKDVDAVIIASPDDTHAALTLAALDAGKPVLCEKPLSPDEGDCHKVLEAEAKTGRAMVQIGFMRRFDPSYARMRAALNEGTLGRALVMHNFHRNVDSPGAWFTGDMAITNSAPHEYDIARFVLGKELVAVSAWQPKRSDDMVAPVIMVLESADGQIVNIEVNNNAAYGYDVRAELVGEKGSVSLTAPVDAHFNLGLQSFEQYAPDWRPRFAEAYRQQNKAWLQSIQSGAPSAIAADAWDGYVATMVGAAGVKALQTGQRVPIDLIAMPDFYQSRRGAA